MKNKKNVIIVSMLVLVAVMAIGYSYFATRLNINATGNITTNWNVYFSNITDGTVVGTASNNKTPSITSTTATMDVNLQLPGDSMTYELTLTNGGTIGAIIEDIKAEAKGSTAIIYSISGLKVGDKLASGASKKLTIKIEYDSTVTSQPIETSKTLTVIIDAVQDIGQSITTEDIVLDGQYGTLATKIINANNPQSDRDLDLTKGSANIGYYTEVHKSDVAFFQTYWDNYVCSTSYSFNKDTGTYTLTGAKDTFSTIDEVTTSYPYSCFSNSESCTTLYKITEKPETYSIIYYDKYTADAQYVNNNGNGLYHTNENTEDNKSTYYFRGNIDNNYVKLGTYKNSFVYSIARDNYGTYSSKYDSMEACQSAVQSNGHKCIEVTANSDILWRIVRINEDGSIRLVSNDVVGFSKFNDPEITGATMASGLGGHVNVGYMYGDPGSNSYLGTHANTNDSLIKTFLDNWYNDNLSNYTSIMSENAGFCNDRSLSSGNGFGMSYTYYGFDGRTKPQFKCPQTNDLFTLKGSNKGNEALTKPIGLLSADEVKYAGVGKSYYLNEELITDSYTMTPYNAIDYFTVYAFSDGFRTYMGGLEYGVRPVINIKGDTNFALEGTGVAGSKTNPYIIKTN